MNRLRLQVSRDGETVLEGDADNYTVTYKDTKSGADITCMWGDEADGLWLYEPGEAEPFRIVPMREE